MRINILSRTKNGMKTYAIRETHPRKKKVRLVRTKKENVWRQSGKDGKKAGERKKIKKLSEVANIGGTT